MLDHLPESIHWERLADSLQEVYMVCITDNNGLLIYAGSSFCQFNQFKGEEWQRRSFFSLLSLDDSQNSPKRKLLKTALQEGKSWEGELKIVNQTGEYFWLYTSFVPWSNEQEGTSYYLVLCSDITERKQEERLLQKRLAGYQDIENALDQSSIVVVTNSKGVITYVNDKFCAISKYARYELIGKTHRLINSNHHPKTFFKQMWQTILSGQVWTGEIKNRAKDGREYWMKTTIVPYLDDKGKPHQFIAIRTDITDRIRAEAELADRTRQLSRARDEAIQANLVKSQFLANMSHELRTPLNAIIGYSEMLMEEADELGELAFVHDLEKISKAGNHLLELINDILDLSKIEAGRTELDLALIFLPALVSDVVHTIAPLSEKGSNKLTHSCIDGQLLTDATKLRQVLLNLLSNATKFTHSGMIGLEIVSEQREGKQGFLFTITDSGIGMSDEQMEKLFQPFSQADATTTRRYGGTGLGLAISQSYVRLMGGNIEVRSTLGKGSSFFFWLPA